MDFLDSAVKGFLGMAVSLFGGNEKKEERNLNAEITLRKLYAECKQNREMISLVKTERINQQSFEAVKAIAPLLRNEAGQLVLLGTPECLEKICLIQEQIDDKDKLGCADEDNELYYAPKTILQAISFCVNKIEVLKNYAQIDADGGAFFKTLVLSKRLENIDRYCRLICESLKSYSPDLRIG